MWQTLETSSNRVLAIDVETYCDLDIKKIGGYRYAENCELLLFAYAYDDEPVEVVDIAQGEKIPASVVEDLFNPNVLKTAYNAQFERAVLGAYFGKLLDPLQWQCTMITSLIVGLPGSLAKDGEALNLNQEEAKMKIGSRLIRYFCCPCKATKSNGGRTRNLPQHKEDDWALFKEYNRRDVETERVIRKKLINLAPKPLSYEHKLWALDQRINDRGINLDMELVKNALAVDESFREETLAEAKRLTLLDNPNANQQLAKWIGRMNNAEPPKSLAKDKIDEIADNSVDIVKRVLKLRKMLNLTSIKKYTAMDLCHCKDGRVRGLLQFYGANRTGRWAGRLIQVHNLKRNSMDGLDQARATLKEFPEIFQLAYDNVPSVLSQLIRTAFIPSEGNMFVISDFSAIEARVIAWLSGERWRQNTFAQGGDIYCASASQMFGVPVEKHGVNGHLRQKGKIAELALGYQGGIGALKAMGADKMGLRDYELKEIVDKWRKASPHIVALWYDLERAVKLAIKYRRTQYVKNLVIKCNGAMLKIVLPSLRGLYYPWPSLIDGQITFKGKNQITSAWDDIETYGGKLVENVVQAIARDCLAEAMMRLDKAGYKIVMHVHDEVIIDCPTDDLDKVNKILATPIGWADGLILNADGFTAKYYMKD